MRVTIPKGAFNPAYLPLLFEEESRYLVLYGGRGGICWRRGPWRQRIGTLPMPCSRGS